MFCSRRIHYENAIARYFISVPYASEVGNPSLDIHALDLLSSQQLKDNSHLVTDSENHIAPLLNLIINCHPDSYQASVNVTVNVLDH